MLADELREQIASGRLRPGERLPPEPKLCARSGLSRSTVREALRLLASQHLIVTTRGVTGGSFVAEPSVARLGDSLAAGVQLLRSGLALDGEHMLEMRELLEVPGAGLAAIRRTEDDLRTMRAALVDPAAGDPVVRVAAYWGFRAALATAVGNPMFELLTRPLREMTGIRELIEIGPEDLWCRIAEADRAVFTCVVGRDETGAIRATREHLRYLGDLYRRRGATAAGTPS